MEQQWLKPIHVYQQCVYHKTQGIGFHMLGLQPQQCIVTVHFEQMIEIKYSLPSIDDPVRIQHGDYLEDEGLSQ